MAVIDFLPDRLNNPPVVWKGFTSGEFLLAAVTGILAGLPLAVPLSLVPFIGWLAFPTCMLLTPLVVVFLGGGWIAGYKRGKPENYIWQRMEELRCRARLSRSMILDSRVWEMKRGAPVKRGGQV
ncbi:TIGR03750 family conjugal transfer protein [Erwinia pyrifoliae]|uniref:TIGR03750 family conjugal transfer protein n=1 Tax=Erwinia pyrifoliae TaxID=79967 RepID=D0UJ08_ERWPY|nr:TIGR03750 family conjugal transfer protein [Erwinia pyrifoliae]ACY01317.1 unknown [Erwinia pyrifoliae]AUX71451.1 TIGR03750 family conjugal transfer protein [Erwinia pyrifoliae]AUX71576.1 TIGR03750 family conjugal transfer protein [Erwinia pyrifoliae]MCA8874819.1 TIGR03750 family conjugal transfer protein [Erwinia pyrifoliae]MCA8878202.1 TIGR03750 family conjugal transfer protein [Erwinia pyrifoliae]